MATGQARGLGARRRTKPTSCQRCSLVTSGDSNVADVLVVGAGAGGAASAWRLAQHGLSVLCLEQGGWCPPETGPGTNPDWERRRLADWSASPNRRNAPADYPVTDDASAIKPLMWNGVGGSTVMWTALMPRLHPSDFRMRRQDGIGADWPLSYGELAPYYDLNEAMNGVAGPVNPSAYPPSTAMRLPPVRLLPAERAVAGAFEALGWHWWPAEVAINTKRHGPGRGICVGCGPCELGCHTRAKASADVVYWPGALAAGARLVTGARVTEILLDARGRARGALWVDRSGHRHVAAARAVVLAANGVGTPRLLLLSASGRFPSGIGNRNALVGRGLMLHPLARVTGRFANWVGGHRGNSGGGIASHQFYETDAQRGFLRGVKLQVMRGTGPALTALGAGGTHLAWGREHRRRFAETFGHVMSVSICTDDPPDSANRIELAPDHIDSDGLPGARMIYSLGANSRAALDFGIARATDLLREAGAQTTESLPLVVDAGFHLMGTAAMGADREAAVTNAWGRVHNVPNLFIADGSVFATAGAVNPANTIQALALRQADHLAIHRRDLPDPY